MAHQRLEHDREEHSHLRAMYDEERSQAAMMDEALRSENLFKILIKTLLKT